MTVYVYHGKGRGVLPQQLARYNCVLTTYTSMSMEAAPKASKQSTNPLEIIDLDDENQNAKLSGEAMLRLLLELRNIGCSIFTLDLQWCLCFGSFGHNVL